MMVEKSELAARAEAYLRTLIEALVNESDRAHLRIEYTTIDRAMDRENGGISVEPVHLFRVAIPPGSVRFVVGKRAANVDALRTLLRAWSGANSWHAKVDVYVRSA